MLKHSDVLSAEKKLMARNYEQFLSSLHRIGRPIKKAWLKSPLSDDKVEKYKFTSNKKFKEFLVNKIEKSGIVGPDNIKDIPQTIKQLKTQLSELALFLLVWKDNPNSSTEEKKLRQEIKFKAPIDKDDRHAINIALQTMAFILCRKSNNFIKKVETLDNYAVDHAFTDEKITDLIKNKRSFLFDHINSLKKFEAYRYSETKITNSEFSLKQEIEKIGKAISAFKTPNKKKKLFKYFGIFLAIITALACGISTGGAIFLLIPGSIVIPCIVGWLLFLFGFKSNYSFFSQNFPNFLLSLAKKGGITEFIDQKGERKQLSRVHKWGTLPLIGLASLAVGIPSATFTYLAILKLATALLPVLAVLWPPLPLIIVGCLAVTLGITLTVSVFTASIDVLKKYLALTLTFKEIFRALKRKFNNLTIGKKIFYMLMGALIIPAVLGLIYSRFAAGIDLSSFTGVIASSIISVIAFIAQLPFTITSVLKLIHAVTPSTDETNTTVSSNHSVISKIFTWLCILGNWLCILGNAVGNACLIALDTLSAPYSNVPLAISGSVFYGLNSLAGNTPEPGVNRVERDGTTQEIIKKYKISFFSPSCDSGNSEKNTLTSSQPSGPTIR